MIVAAQHGELPARGRVVQADLAIQADDQPPAVRQEERGEIPRMAAEDGDGPARGGVPQAAGLPIQRADPLPVRAVRQPFDRFLMPAQDVHGFSRRQLPETDGLVGRAGGEAFAVGAVGQRGDGALMPAQGRDGRTGRHVPDVDGARVAVHARELVARRADDRPWPQEFRGRFSAGHHGAGAIEPDVQVSPLPAAVLRRGRLEGPPGRVAMLELQGRRGGRDVRSVAFPALGRTAVGPLPCVVGPLPCLDRLPPLPEDRREGKEARHHHGAQRRRRHRVSPTPPDQATERPRPARPDRLVVQEPGQVRRQLARRRVPPRRVPSPGTSNRSSPGPSGPWR